MRKKKIRLAAGEKKQFQREAGRQNGYEIVGKECGRDSVGVFHCKCGMCRQLSKEGQNGCDGSNNGCDS